MPSLLITLLPSIIELLKQTPEFVHEAEVMVEAVRGTGKLSSAQLSEIYSALATAHQDLQDAAKA